MADPVPPRKGARKSGVTMKSPRLETGDVAPPSTMSSPVALAAAFQPVAETSSAADLPVAAPEPAVAALPESTPAAVDAAPEPAASSVGTAPDPVVPGAPVEVAPEPVPTPENIVSAAAEHLKKGYQTMATTFDSTAATFATDKAKAMFGDVSERTKGAMEKSVKLGEEMTEFTKGNVEALVASGRIAAKGAETLAQDVAETMKKHFEGVTAQMKSVASVKSPTELFQLQSEYAKSSFDSAVAEASKFSESMMKLMGDIAQPLSSRYAVAAEKIKATSL